MVETTAYFEAYRYVLEGLQEQEEEDLPFQRCVYMCLCAVERVSDFTVKVRDNIIPQRLQSKFTDFSKDSRGEQVQSIFSEHALNWPELIMSPWYSRIALLHR